MKRYRAGILLPPVVLMVIKSLPIPVPVSVSSSSFTPANRVLSHASHKSQFNAVSTSGYSL